MIWWFYDFIFGSINLAYYVSLDYYLFFCLRKRNYWNYLKVTSKLTKWATKTIFNAFQIFDYKSFQVSGEIIFETRESCGHHHSPSLLPTASVQRSQTILVSNTLGDEFGSELLVFYFLCRQENNSQFKEIDTDKRWFTLKLFQSWADYRKDKIYSLKIHSESYLTTEDGKQNSILNVRQVAGYPFQI